MEYRANFLVTLLMSLSIGLWVIGAAIVFFYHRNNLAGWSFDQLLLVSGLWIVFSGVAGAILSPNVSRMVEHIQRGTMDFVLIKPANSQFLATLTACSPLKLIDIVTGMSLVVMGLYRLGHWPSMYQWASFLVMIPAGVVMTYAFWVLLVTLAFWFVRVDNFPEIFWTFFECGRFPVNVYRNPVRFLLTFVVPVAFLTTFPAATLLGLISPTYVIASVVVAMIALFASTRFWRYAVRFYSSASS